jgi:hypothetical protein
MKPKSFTEAVPTHLHDFKDLFLKASFDQLPDQKIWNHVIELTPDAKPSSCKIYLIAPNEQAELDEFIQENQSNSLLEIANGLSHIFH